MWILMLVILQGPHHIPVAQKSVWTSQEQCEAKAKMFVEKYSSNPNLVVDSAECYQQIEVQE